MFKGRRAESDNGWTGYGPWPYTILDESGLAHHIERLALAHTEGATESLTIQPFPAPNKNQDRHTITQWDTPQGTWKIFSVFDGHAGHETVNHANKHLIPALEAALLLAQSSQPEGQPLEPARVVEVLKKSVSSFDDEITRRFLELFPGGPEALSTLTDDEIRAISMVDGMPHPAVGPCIAGSTVLVALLDPSRQLYVVSLGDSIASSKDETGSWKAELLSAFHNGLNPEEVERLKNEHPDQPDVVANGRVLGGIAVTRALGDHIFKLPSIYADRIFRLAYADSHIMGKADGFLPRCLTPPYLSNVPDVTHVDLSEVSPENSILLLASDGLGDLQDVHDKIPIPLAERWVRVAAESDKPALSVLRDAMGGSDLEKASFWITVEMEEPWMDDTTIVVTKL